MRYQRKRALWFSLLSLLIPLLIAGFQGNTEQTQTAEAAETMTYTAYLPSTYNKGKPRYSGPTFLETFDGAPSNPTPWVDTDWHVTLHKRNNARLFQSIPFEVDHGGNCEGPSSTHTVVDHQDHLFTCRNHMMTALYGEDDVVPGTGYGVIYFSPNVAIDLNEYWAIQFDVSMMRTSKREWVDVWITPWDHQMQTPLQEELPDLNGPPDHAIRVLIDQMYSTTDTIAPEYYVNEKLYDDRRDYITNEDYTDFITPDRARRDTIRIEHRSGTLTTYMVGVGPDGGDVKFSQVTLPQTLLNQGEAIIQFGHHSYVPNKNCNFFQLDFADRCGPNTYHWDNIIVENAIPFRQIGIIGAEPVVAVVKSLDYVPSGAHDEVLTGPVTLHSPAPANAKLRFSGSGNTMKVRFDGGAWVTAPIKTGALNITDDSKAFMDYEVAIPAGTTQIEFFSNENGDKDMIIRDPVVISPPDRSISHPKVTNGLPAGALLQGEFDFAKNEAFCAVG